MVGKQGAETVLEARRRSEDPGTEQCAGLSRLGGLGLSAAHTFPELRPGHGSPEKYPF